MAIQTAYQKKLLDPKWQKKRLEILNRDKWVCRMCCDGKNTLQVHHKYYIGGKNPWEYDDHILVTLCSECHEHETEQAKQGDVVMMSLKMSNFFLSEAITIVQSLSFTEPVYNSEVHAAALSWALQDNEMQQIISDRYFEHLEKKSAEKNG
jgi:hypothetical protein